MTGLSTESEMKEQRVRQIIESLRPHLQKDGGDVRFVRLTNEGIVEVEFLGECKTCSLAIMTLRAGIERSIILQVDGIKRIEFARDAA